MKPFFYICLLGISLFACQEGPKKPQPFLDKDRMSALLIDVQTLEAVLQQEYRQNYKSDSIRLITNCAYARLFEKYGINDSIYRAHLYYYTYHHEAFNEIQDRVTDHFTPQDSIE